MELCTPSDVVAVMMLLADETRQRLCCSQLPVCERTGLFVGCFDTPSHFVIWGARCSSDHIYTLHSKSVTSAL